MNIKIVAIVFKIPDIPVWILRVFSLCNEVNSCNESFPVMSYWNITDKDCKYLYVYDKRTKVVKPKILGLHLI